jgi:hypothetical protein
MSRFDDKREAPKGYDNGVGIYVQQQAITLEEYKRRMETRSRNHDDDAIGQWHSQPRKAAQ